jgi:hypothetical protein
MRLGRRCRSRSWNRYVGPVAVAPTCACCVVPYSVRMVWLNCACCVVRYSVRMVWLTCHYSQIALHTAQSFLRGLGARGFRAFSLAHMHARYSGHAGHIRTCTHRVQVISLSSFTASPTAHWRPMLRQIQESTAARMTLLASRLNVSPCFVNFSVHLFVDSPPHTTFERALVCAHTLVRSFRRSPRWSTGASSLVTTEAFWTWATCLPIWTTGTRRSVLPSSIIAAVSNVLHS